MSSPSFFSDYLGDRESLAGASRGRGRLRAGAIGCGCLLAASPVMAQEALRNSLVGDAAAEARHVQSESLPYTFKSGDLKVLVVPSIGMDWNDNVNLVHTNAQQDVILRPQVQLNASYPMTQYNLLSLNVGFGYNRYFDHDEYSSWFLKSGTELSFDIYVKDFWINLHDRVTYAQDPAQQALLFGTGSYGVINNDAGLSVTWDLNQVTLSAGYDHQNEISTSAQYDSQNSATEMIFTRAGLHVSPSVTTGIEGTASFTTYQQQVLNNNNAYSAGVYADWQPGTFFRVQPRMGYTIIQYQNTSQTMQTSDLHSWYADLNITHQATGVITYSLDAGHEVLPGIQSDATEDWYVRPSIHWDIIKNLSLSTSFSYQNGQQGVGNVSGNLTENYNWLGANLGASYMILKKLSLGMSYRLTLRSSSVPSDEYTQNVVGLTLTYQTQ